jgi:Domain of unknown function (DUF1905)/Bacteriocin-protection, YdeI or OmpD-Associated
MDQDKPLVNKTYLLEKFVGKGGWTYAEIPEIKLNKKSPFGCVRVRGTIDNFEIKHYNLMSMGNGKLFLPIKTEIRKKINKQAGDSIEVILFADNLPTEIPEELKLCLMFEPNGLDLFLKYSNCEQKAFIDWIYAAKTDETKINRIANTLDKIAKGQKLIGKK